MYNVHVPELVMLIFTTGGAKTSPPEGGIGGMIGVAPDCLVLWPLGVGLDSGTRFFSVCVDGFRLVTPW